MNRRGFLASMFAACAAPALVRAESLMRVVPTSVIYYSTPPAGKAIRVISWLGVFKLPENIEGIYYSEPTTVVVWENAIRVRSSATVQGFLAKNAGGLYLADAKLIASWEAVALPTAHPLSQRPIALP